MAQLIDSADTDDVINRLNEIHIEPAPFGIIHRVLRDEPEASSANVTHQRADREALRALVGLRV